MNKTSLILNFSIYKSVNLVHKVKLIIYNLNLQSRKSGFGVSRLNYGGASIPKAKNSPLAVCRGIHSIEA